MPLMVSVSGIRGVVGESLTPEVILRFSAAYAAWCRARGAGAGDAVVLGRDGRPSGTMVRDLVAGTLRAAGLAVVDLGLCSTPGTAMAVAAQGAVGGVVITASHNPAPWNALKFLDGEGNFLTKELGEEVLAIERRGAFVWEGHESLGAARTWDGADEHHVAAILALPWVDAAAIAARAPSVVVDAVNAAGSRVAPLLLERLGARPLALHCDGDGRFPHAPEPRPENLRGLADAVRAKGADLGVALDPDADRLVLVDETGTVLSEEYTVALAADHVLARTPGPVAVNLSTSRLAEDVAARHGQPCYRSPVGEAHVVAAMREHGAVVGGEGNGGVILPALHAGRDGLVGIALILTAMAERDARLSELAAALPSYVMEKRRLDLAGRADPERLRVLAREYFTGDLDERDGVKAVLPEGWIHVRPSNTEAIVRIIGESADAAWLARVLDEAERFFAAHLG
ncbi:MAG: phosphoglucosamine mutase [Candidatus Krumholzibacteriota bacterium]|nr:phosphoglucosamine mutase [Candidatus Krumholzibacteriota bacterium]